MAERKLTVVRFEEIERRLAEGRHVREIDRLRPGFSSARNFRSVLSGYLFDLVQEDLPLVHRGGI